MKPDSGKRIFYFDFLRVISALAVVSIHVTSAPFTSLPVCSQAWDMNLLYNSAVHWAVPVFVMISGALFLGNQKRSSWQRILKVSVRHLLFLYLSWSLLYSIQIGWSTMIQSGPVQFVKIVLDTFFGGGRYHLWFLPMLIGLYLAEPLVNCFVKNRSLLRYFLVLGLIFSFLLPGLEKMQELFLTTGAAEKLGVYVQIVLGWCRDFEPAIGASQYLYYFVLGYALATCPVQKLKASSSWLLILTGYVFTVSVVWSASYHTQTMQGYFVNTWTLMMAAGIFSLARIKCPDGFSNRKVNQFLQIVSGWSLGIYLVHVMILEGVQYVFPSPETIWQVVWQMPVQIILVFTISMLLSALLSRIPYVRKLVQN